MKILHTSDWHLGKRLGTFSRLPEQRRVLQELITLCELETPDLILVAGDLFDAFNPPTEAVELLYSTLKKLTRQGTCPVVALAGNHDSPERIEAPDPLARECGIFFLGYPDSLPGETVLETGLTASFPVPGLLELGCPGVSHPVRIISAPYANENRLRRYLGEEDREEALRTVLQSLWTKNADTFFTEESVNLFAGHFFMGRRNDLFQEVIEEEGERPILFPGGLEMIYTDNLPRGLHYAALGHLHRFQKVEDLPFPVCYSGSPLAYSLSEASQSKGVILVDAEPKKKAAFRFCPLTSGKPVLRKTFGNPEELKEWLGANPECYIEITLKTKEFISGTLKQELLGLHQGILALIPLIEEEERDSEHRKVDLGRSVEDLFIDYFREASAGVMPDEALLGLFREVSAAGEGEA